MTWDEENNQALEKCFRQLLSASNPSGMFGPSLELYVTAACNKKCEYCYLVKYGDQLYPKQYDSPDIILHNLHLLTEYIVRNKIPVPNIDIFSGEIWHTKFGIDVLKEILELCKQVKVDKIMIPSNFTFIDYPKYVEGLEKLIDAFAYYGTVLLFSCSVDGRYLDSDTRPSKGHKKRSTEDDLDKFYEKVFPFCKKHGFGFHPMISAYSIEHWKENYTWWFAKLNEYEFEKTNDIMFLEVRNNDWTHDKIVSYLEFLNYIYDAELNGAFNGDELALLYSMSGIKRLGNNYEVLSIGCPKNLGAGCSLDRMACVRLGDLSWVPCHRTSYEKLVYGQFVVNDDKITGMKANNLPLMLAIGTTSYKGRMKCDRCPIGPICVRGCLGAQFETTKELFYPCPTVCDLFMAKTLFLYHKVAKKNAEIKDETLAKHLDALYKDNISKISQEDLDKWMTTINNLI